jgi:hypothetical protein
MEKLRILLAKLQAYRILPQPEYRSIGEHLFEDVNSIINELDEYKASIDKDVQDKYTKLLLGHAESGKYIVIENLGGYRIFVQVLKEKIK